MQQAVETITIPVENGFSVDKITDPAVLTINTDLSPKTYFPELDGLRFFAFLLVFIHHAPLLSHNILIEKLNTFGWMGVDLFLCLSAYLFTKLLQMEYQKCGGINVWFFYLRRGLRIWPVYYFFVLLCIALTVLNHQPVSTGRILGLVTFTDNIADAFVGYNLIYFLSHIWTISYEEQFYAVIPWVLKNLFKYSQKERTRILAAFLLGGMAIRGILIWINVPHPAIWVLPISHFDSIFIGVMIGMGSFDSVLKNIPRIALAMMGFICLAIVCFLPNVDIISWMLMLTYPLVGIGWGLILMFVLDSPGLIKKFLSLKPINFLGKISYGLYLYHLLGLGFANLSGLRLDKVYRPLISKFIIPLLLTITFSIVSYFLIEKPFLRMKSRFTIVESRPV